MPETSVAKRTKAIKPEIMPAQMSLFDRGSAIGERFEKRVGEAYADFLKEAIPFAYDVLHERAWEAEELPFECRREDTSLALQDYLQGAFGARASMATARQQAAIVSMLVLDKIGVPDVIGIHFRSLLALSEHASLLSAPKRLELINKARGSTVETFAALVESTATGRPTEPKRRKEFTGSESSIRTIEKFDHDTSQDGDTRPLADKVADLAEEKQNRPEGRTQLRIFAVGLDKPERQELYALWAEHEQRVDQSMAGLDFWGMLDRTLIGRLRRDLREGDLEPEEEATFTRLEKKLA